MAQVGNVAEKLTRVPKGKGAGEGKEYKKDVDYNW
jgi:hypothetical protein